MNSHDIPVSLLDVEDGCARKGANQQAVVIMAGVCGWWCVRGGGGGGGGLHRVVPERTQRKREHQ